MTPQHPSSSSVRAPRAGGFFVSIAPRLLAALATMAGVAGVAPSVAHADAPSSATRESAVWRRVGNAAGPDVRTTPLGREGHAMVFDAARGRGLLFGGRGESGASLDDTWEYDGNAWTRVDDGDADAAAKVAAPAPAPREGHAMAFDRARGRVLLFGGRSCDAAGACTPLGDAWIHDAQGWTPLDVKGAGASKGPSPRYDAAMAYDDDRGVLVLHGGRSCDAADATCESRETWELDGGEWTRRMVAAPFADARLGGLVFDPSLGHVIAFGADRAATRAPRVAAWDGLAWFDLDADPSAAPPLASLAAVYDSTRARVVVLGDAPDGTRSTARTVEWDGQAWFERTPMDAPERRSGAAMYFDSSRGRVVVFGGLAQSAGDGPALPRDTWEYDASHGELAQTCNAAVECATGLCVAHACALEPASSGDEPRTGAGDTAATEPPAKGVVPADFSSLRGSPVWFGNPRSGACGCRTTADAAGGDGTSAPLAFAVTAVVVAGAARRRRRALSR